MSTTRLKSASASSNLRCRIATFPSSLSANATRGCTGQQQAQQPEAPAQPPPTIQLGQTIDEVKGLLGEPTKVGNLGIKQIYIYKDMKVVFLRGKVADVQ